MPVTPPPGIMSRSVAGGSAPSWGTIPHTGFAAAAGLAVASTAARASTIPARRWVRSRRGRSLDLPAGADLTALLCLACRLWCARSDLLGTAGRPVAQAPDRRSGADRRERGETDEHDRGPAGVRAGTGCAGARLRVRAAAAAAVGAGEGEVVLVLRSLAAGERGRQCPHGEGGERANEREHGPRLPALRHP